jgi:hypothetical protein
MASPKVKLEGKKIAEKVMEFMDEYSFDPIYNEIEKNGDDTYISEILRCFPTRRIINDLDERGELHEAYKEYVDMNGVTLVKDIAKRMTNKEKLELVSELFKIPYLASPEEYGEAIAKAAREQYYRQSITSKKAEQNEDLYSIFQ